GLAFLGLVTATPTILLNLYGGVIADRFDQRLLILLVSTTIGVLLAVMGLLVALDVAAYWNILLLSFFIAGAQAFDNPARQALYPHLIARKDLMNAVALNSIVWQGTRVVGPLIAGALIASVGSAPALFLASIGFAFMVVAMSMIPPPPKPPPAPRSGGQNQNEGIGYVVRNQIFAVLIGLTFLNSFFGMSFIILMPIFATDILEVGPEGLGQMHAVAGVGAIVMALVAAAMSKSRNKGLWLVSGAVVFGATVVVFAVSTSYPLSLAVLFIGGAASTFYMVMVQTSLQALVPDHLRGRVFSIYSLTWSLLPLGGLQAGLVADWVSPQFAVALGGAVVAVVAVSVLLLHQVRIVGITPQQALDRASA
ncbi:MAG: MFS transporter, partial [Chloroflexota bacterium]|nr:MFS transporter [Chloroflexota bacterium]